jgi:hypothetical protein
MQGWYGLGRDRPEILPEATTRRVYSTIRSALYTAFLVMALCGLRRGETAGLRWSNLDLDAGLAYVTRQVQCVKGVLTPPRRGDADAAGKDGAEGYR